ncbi:MAG TPA: PilZ domain-containing protein [Myxococcaceae bacterium]|nr:PilZ domain-containing protein [Myxococcaceae bacterium]
MTPSTANVRGRYHPRVEANLMVLVHLKERTVLAKAKDLSMAGLFLLAHPADSLRKLSLSVSLPEAGEFTTDCIIVRREANGVALEFEGLDWDHFLVLARYLHPRLP